MRVAATLSVLVLLRFGAPADTGEIGGVVALVHSIPAFDKVAHFLFALGLGAIVEAAHGGGGRALKWVIPIVALEELSQLFIPGRSFDLLDLAADIAGLVGGTAAVVSARRRLVRTPSSVAAS